MATNTETERPEGLWRTEQAAEYLGVSPAWMKLHRYKKDGPVYVRIGKTSHAAIRYRKQDLDRFIESRTVDNGAPNNGKG